MTMKQVRYTPAASTALSSLDRAVREALAADMLAYAEDPAGFDVIELSGYDVRRVVLGDYRVIFTETRTQIAILDLGRRDHIYGNWPPRR